MTTRDSSADTDLPPAEWLEKLPHGDGEDVLLSAGGWGLIAPDPRIDWEGRGPAKPEMVQRDNEQAWREGFRER